MAFKIDPHTALNKLAFGPSERDLQTFRTKGAEGWLAEQLRPPAEDDCVERIATARLHLKYVSKAPEPEAQVDEDRSIAFIAEPIEQHWKSIGHGLQTVARVIRMDLGIRALAVDMNGWDTHENQPPKVANLAGQMSRALAAFHADLHDRLDRVVLVAMSEFGRRLRSNKSNGTDHGHAGVTMVFAPRIAGGRIHGAWPGLASDQLDNAVDLAMTTDIRSILAELMAGPLATPHAVAATFPEFTPKKVGLV